MCPFSIFAYTKPGLLHPNTTYTLRWRLRPGGEDPPINFGFGWGQWIEPAFQCTTLPQQTLGSPPGVLATKGPPLGVSAKKRPPPGVSATPPGVPSVRTLRLYRSSEFTLHNVDFLMNHSSGDARAQSVLLTDFDRVPLALTLTLTYPNPMP